MNGVVTYWLGVCGSAVVVLAVAYIFGLLIPMALMAVYP